MVIVIHFNLLYMSLPEQGTFRTFGPAYFKSHGLYLCYYLSSHFIRYANLCSSEGPHSIRVGDCWLKCVFLGNLQYCATKKYRIFDGSEFSMKSHDNSQGLLFPTMRIFEGKFRRNEN